MRQSLWSVLFLSVLIVPARVHASAVFPKAIQEYFDPPLADPPHCTLCHMNDNGGKGTIVTPFGLAMLTHFEVKGMDNIAGLVAALDAMKAEGWDGDGDGRPDVDELDNGGDPNTNANVPTQPTADGPIPPSYRLPGYGCNVPGGGPAPTGAWTMGATLAWGLLLRRLGAGGRRR